MSEKVYRWSNPYEWLEEKSQRWSKERLRHELLNLARAAGSDALQDEYQSDMDKDGYFSEGA